MTILPSTYLPSIEYLAHILQRECVVDYAEHYIKRSARNRARIMTASGVMELSVNVCNANRPRTPMHRVEIDYSKRWQHQHWLAIVSAYRSSPFFEHYEHLFEPLFGARYERLVDLNEALLGVVLRILVSEDRRPVISEVYVEGQPADVDLRPKRRDGSGFSHESYVQVFYDREPFVSNLSVLDLIFNEGGNARAVLERCVIG